MHLLDIILIIIPIVACCYGFARGLVKQIGDIAAFILALLMTRLFGAVLTGLYGALTSETYATILSYITVFLVVYIGVKIIAAALKFALKATRLSFLDRIGGAIFSIFEWLFFASIIFHILTLALPAKKSVFTNDEKPYRVWVYDLAPKTVGFVQDKIN